jgi:hypothetical protein
MARMDPKGLKDWIDVVKELAAIIAALVAGFWAWSRFVIERGLLPPSEMNLDLQIVGSSDVSKVVEATIRIRNKGTSALIVTDLRIRLRYLNDDDRVDVIDDPTLAAFGRVRFPHAHVLNEVGATERAVKQVETVAHRESRLGSGEFLLVPYDTFVQPGVEQPYSFVTALPAKSAYVLARASFRYEMRPSAMQLWFLRVSRRLGMLQYSLEHIRKPHTIERSFKIGG